MDRERGLEQKYRELKSRIALEEKAAVAFSGGVDSAFLLYVANEALGGRTVALTIPLHAFPRRELRMAEEFCKERGIRQIVEAMDEFSIEGFADNPPDRCYLCKRALFSRMKELAEGEGAGALLEGSNLDDEGDYRPGLRALRELGIRSPLREAGFTKKDIRRMSRILGLPTWDKPSMACLASRFAYGERITQEKLMRVEQAEESLRELGFTQLRVRAHGNLARIELLAQELERLSEERLRKEVDCRIRELGFSYVTLDLGGFRSGSMNRELKEDWHG